jgi:hypothetical protein
MSGGDVYQTEFTEEQLAVARRVIEREDTALLARWRGLADQGLTIAEGAARLGVSSEALEDAIRRRADALIPPAAAPRRPLARSEGSCVTGGDGNARGVDLPVRNGHHHDPFAVIEAAFARGRYVSPVDGAVHVVGRAVSLVIGEPYDEVDELARFVAPDLDDDLPEEVTAVLDDDALPEDLEEVPVMPLAPEQPLAERPTLTGPVETQNLLGVARTATDTDVLLAAGITIHQTTRGTWCITLPRAEHRYRKSYDGARRYALARADAAHDVAHPDPGDVAEPDPGDVAEPPDKIPNDIPPNVTLPAAHNMPALVTPPASPVARNAPSSEVEKRQVPAHDARCPNGACGLILTGGGAPRGWVLLRIVGGGPPRRYCSPDCAAVALFPLPALPEPRDAIRVTPSHEGTNDASNEHTNDALKQETKFQSKQSKQAASPGPQKAAHRWTDAERADLAHRYRLGESLLTLAQARGLTVSTIRAQLLRSGVQLRPPGRHAAIPPATDRKAAAP